MSRRNLVGFDVSVRRSARDRDGGLDVNRNVVLSVHRVQKSTIVHEVASVRVQIELPAQVIHFHLQSGHLIFQEHVSTVLFLAGQHTLDANFEVFREQAFFLEAYFLDNWSSGARVTCCAAIQTYCGGCWLVVCYSILLVADKTRCTAPDVNELFEAERCDLFLQIVDPLANVLHVSLLHLLCQVALLFEQFFKQVCRLLALVLHLCLEVHLCRVKEAFHIFEDGLRSSQVETRLEVEVISHVNLGFVHGVQGAVERL